MHAIKEAGYRASLIPFERKTVKERKRDFRSLWNVKINAAARLNGMKYNQLINLMQKKNVKLDRKILADLAENEPKVFAKVLEAVK